MNVGRENQTNFVIAWRYDATILYCGTELRAYLGWNQSFAFALSLAE